MGGQEVGKESKMIIKLKEIQSYYINLDEDLHKKESIINFTKYYNMVEPIRIPAIRSSLYQVGLAESYKNALILGVQTKKPFLVLEDDSYPVKNIPEEIMLPDDADAIYLGCNTWGVPQNHKMGEDATENGARFSLVPGYENIFRVRNTLSSHAILYINPVLAATAAASLNKIGIDYPEHLDMQLYKDGIFEKFNVYVTGPIFYQHDIRNVYATHSTRDISLRDFII